MTSDTSSFSTSHAEIRRGNEFYAAGAFDSARLAFERAIESKPDDPHAAAGLAKVLILEGAFTDAKELYEAAFGAGLEKSAEHLMNFAICYAFEGDRASARTLLEGAVAVDPSYEPAYGALARHCEIMGDYVAAERYATEGLRLFPANVPCYETRAAARLAMLKFDGTATDADAALRLDPKSVDAMLCKAAVLIARQRTPEAVDVLGQAQDIEPENAEVVLALGNAHQLTGQLELAESSYQRARELEPANWRVYQSFAGLELVRGNAAAGLENAELALELQDAPILRFLRGSFLAKLGRGPEAKEEFSKATAANPLDALSWVGLAELEAAQAADRTAALQHAREALKLDPDGVAGERAQRVIQRLGV